MALAIRPQLPPAAVMVFDSVWDGCRVAIVSQNAKGRPTGEPIILTPAQACDLGASLIEMAEQGETRWPK